MKKLVMICIAIATLQVSAQEQKREMRKLRTASRTSFTPEEMAQLQAKKMVLTLDLNEKQQKEMSALLLEQAKLRQSEREAFINSKKDTESKTLTKDDRFKMANAKLDKKIEKQKKIKRILSDEQYQKWAKMEKKRNYQGKNQAMRYKNKGHKMAPKKTAQ